MNKLRKFLVVSVMVLSVIAMSGIAGIGSAQAAASAGDLIKMDGLSSVYYLGEDGKRYVFPNESTYFSWYADFSSVVTIPASELQSYPLGGNVTMRPGTTLVKITTDPSVYAVEPNGTLRKIANEAQAAALYGPEWNKRIVDLADSFFVNYTIGAPLADGEIPAGSLVKNADSPDVYYYDGTDFRPVSSEGALAANRLWLKNIMTVDNTFTPVGAALSGMEAGLIKVNQGSGTGQVVTGSGLMVSLNAQTPVGQAVPQVVGRIPFTKINLTASNDGAANISAITITRTGLTGGDYSNFEVWLEKDGVTVANKRALTSNNNVTLALTPVLTVSAGQTVALDVFVATKGTGNLVTGNAALGIISASDVVASVSTITGSFPVMGNIMNFTDYTVAELNFQADTSTKTKKVGDTDVDLVSFDIFSSDRDVIFKSITLRNDGTEDLSVLSNLRLENNGNVVTDAVVINGRYATFNLKSGGLTLLKDEGTQTFYLKGDIDGKEQTLGSTIIFKLNKNEDLVAYEKATGFGVSYDNANTGNFGTITIEGSAITISRHKDNPSSQKVTAGDTNVVALMANIKAEEAVSAEGLVINYSQKFINSTTTAFTNARIYLNNIFVGSFNPVVGVATNTLEVASSSINSTVYLNKGDNKLEVKVNVKSGDTYNGDTIAFNVDRKDLLDGAEYVSNGQTVQPRDISGTAIGGTLTVTGAGELDVAIDADTPEADILLAGVQNQEIAKFKFTAKNTDLDIKEIKLYNASSTKPASTTDEAYNLINSIDVYDGGNKLGSLTDEGNGEFTFKQDIALSASVKKVLTFKANLANITNIEDTDKNIKLAISNIEFKQKNKTAISESVATNNVAETFVIRTTKPVFTKLAGSSVQGFEHELLRFSVAAQGGDIKLIFASSTENGHLLDFTGNYDAASTTNVVIKELNKDAVIASSTSTTTEVEISGGSTKTFVVLADTVGVDVDAGGLGIALNRAELKWEENINAEFTEKNYGMNLIKQFPINNFVTFK